MPAENEDEKVRAYVIEKIKAGEIDIGVVLYFFNSSVEAYKIAQELFLKIDKKIHNEFAYCARAFASYIQSDQKDVLALADAFQASRHILNDSLDLIVGYSAKQTAILDEYCREKSVADVYPEFTEKKIASLIKNSHLLIAKSRRERGLFRLTEYLEFLKSDKYETLIYYCLEIPNIFTALKKQRSDGKHWLGYLVA